MQLDFAAAFATATLAFAACAVEPVATEVPRPDVPEAIAVPEGHRVAAAGHATGVQVYECAPDASMALAWRLRAPRAELFDDASLFATHFGGVDVGSPAGPYWRSTDDGSSVHGGNAASAPNPGNIPFLRLDALDVAGTGVFGRVSFIHRLATAGGIGPSGACESASLRMEVPYTADYYFYEPL
jgi:hypothetical protein